MCVSLVAMILASVKTTNSANVDEKEKEKHACCVVMLKASALMLKAIHYLNCEIRSAPEGVVIFSKQLYEREIFGTYNYQVQNAEDFELVRILPFGK